VSTPAGLAQILTHPAIWRGSQAAPRAAISTGFAALDACLPGRGWPRAGLIEILREGSGLGEISLILPALANLLSRREARWCAWVAPAGLGSTPLEPYAPALAAAGLALDRMLVVRPDVRLPTAPLWAFGEALRSGACEAALAWLHPRMLELRRLQLAAERGRTLGILFRDRCAASEPSAATLRVLLEHTGQGMRLTILKSRGGFRGTLDLSWPLPPGGSDAPASRT
jgi:cell division inhibitor SulA/protein ImuA